MRKIAEVIGEKLHIPVRSVSEEDAPKYLEWMTDIVGTDEPATAHKTKKLLGWEPRQIGLLEELRRSNL